MTAPLTGSGAGPLLNIFAMPILSMDSPLRWRPLDDPDPVDPALPFCRIGSVVGTEGVAGGAVTSIETGGAVASGGIDDFGVAVSGRLLVPFGVPGRGFCVACGSISRDCFFAAARSAWAVDPFARGRSLRDSGFGLDSDSPYST